MAPSKSKATASKPLDLDNLHGILGAIFEQAQLSVANHKKNCVALYKIHVQASEVTETVAGKKKGTDTIQYIGEEAFQEAFLELVSRVLVAKKGVGNADRVVKYIGSFVKFMNEKGMLCLRLFNGSFINSLASLVIEAKSQEASSSSASARQPREDEDEENSVSRFTSSLLNFLIPGFVAKDKNVRYRCIQIVAEIIGFLGEIDEDTYDELKSALTDRLNDKEVYIRAHAIIALSKLVGSEDEEEMKDSDSILQTLLHAISADPAGEVRRAALLHTPILPISIDTLLSRTRDVDAITRKLVYGNVLQTKLGDPRLLSIAQREQLVKDGLGDREPSVRLAAGKLVASWFDAAIVDVKKDEYNWEGDDGGAMKGLVHFLTLFDVVGPGEAIAVDALLSIFTTRPDVTEAFVFTDVYWKELTPESAILARVFVEHCIKSKNEAKLDSASLPVVTAFAFHIQEAYNRLLSVLQDIANSKLMRAGTDNEEEDEELEEELAKREVIMSELLKMALKLDYADEIGRRKVFSVVKDMLAHPQLPPGLIERCLDVLKGITPSERDLIRIVVEIIVELRESEEEEAVEENLIDDGQSDISVATTRKDRTLRKKKSRDDLSPEEKYQADVTDIRCLMLCIAMLERVHGTFEDNSTLEGILGDLIIPSVKRKELAMREKALVSLGLCCLIAKNMALSSFQLFMSQAQNAPSELKIQVFRIILDLLVMYDQDFFGRSEEISKRIVDFLLQSLESEESPEAQAILATGLCKLLLAGIIKDDRVLTCLALLYVSPTTTENQALRQCLAYFFPVYAYASVANRLRVQSVFISTFDLAVRMHQELDDDQQMISPYQFGLLMVDWTNPHRAAIRDAEGENAHVHLAIDIIAALYDSDRSADEQKTLCQLLGQLQIDNKLDTRSIQKLNILISNHEDQCPFENATIEKLFDKFRKRFMTMFEEELKSIDPRQFIDDEFRDIYQRIGVEVPGEREDGASRRAKGKRRAKDDDDDDEEEEDEEEEEEAGVSEEEDEQEQEEEEEEEKAADGGMEKLEEAASDTISEKTQKDDDTQDLDESTVNSEESQSESQSRESSRTPTPPPAPGKRGGRKPAPAKAAKPAKAPAASRTKRGKQDPTASPSSNEENIPPASVTLTPKKKGVKRVHEAVPGIVNSPANRKRTRVKEPPKSKKQKDITPTNSDNEDDDVSAPPSPTPKRPTRQTRTRKAAPAPAPTARAKGKKVKAPSPVPSAPDSDNDADEVASVLGASSDDFGGY
ncbi:hypothetical protein CVT24_010736 [Panaeolus cyanescens]|uniref:Nuclear condensin complex subunit 3 C-terminal domain-containing protein n=1 Tax=Panaeolus cyanescens TaxID=181874 RepID=A0A409WE33_9AGAR|nr:hypothetical protein CVT24_010736 [Panaeolus cyanescens]